MQSPAVVVPPSRATWRERVRRPTPRRSAASREGDSRGGDALEIAIQPVAEPGGGRRRQTPPGSLDEAARDRSCVDRPAGGLNRRRGRGAVEAVRLGPPFALELVE